MSGKDKESTFNKFKQFFRMSGEKSRQGVRERDDISLTSELEREIRQETPIVQRCKALRELGDVVLTNRLEETALKQLWELTKDLIVPHRTLDQRHTALNFYKKLIQGQYENLSLMRAHFFAVIQDHDVPEDIQLRLELLKTLTENGKDIKYFEEEIGKFMLDWLQNIVEADLTDSYLEIFVNIIKFNSAHLENEIFVGIVQHACMMSCSIEQTHTVLLWLSIIDAVICYSILPNETLRNCIFALCKTVNREFYWQTSWKIMKNLLGTNMGHSCLLIMCGFLTDKRFGDDAFELLRGAVFHISTGLWGSSGSSTSAIMKCSPGTVLTSFLSAIDSNPHIVVTYEVIQSVQRLIQKCGNELPEHSWDVICDILVSTTRNIEFYEKNGLKKGHPVSKIFHEILDSIEQMLQRDEIAVEPEKIYSIVERVSEDRPEFSVLKLMEYRTVRLSATKPQWLQTLHDFIGKFYKVSKTQVRVKAIQSLMQVMESNRAGYEEEILDRIVLPIFSNSVTEQDLAVRTAVSRMLVDFTLHCDTKRCLELLDIIDKLLNRPFELNSANSSYIFEHENEVNDVIVLVEGLIKIFMRKMYHQPAGHAVRVYHILIAHLELHYNRQQVILAATTIKSRIFSWMLNVRANATFHIGYPDPSQNNKAIKFSHYLGIEGPHQQQYAAALHEKAAAAAGGGQQSSSDSISVLNFTTISIRRGCKIIVRCLAMDHDWTVIQLILTELPNIMQNKAVIQGNDVDALARTLYTMYFDDRLYDKYLSTNPKPTMSDVKNLILPAIASLAPYHQYIEPTTQKGIVESLKKGLFSRIPKLCVQALTFLILEMSDTLVKLLPSVLWDMTRMSNTPQVGIPVLEFMSTLSRLPNHKFLSFVTTQYMYVFAISIPYTNPDRYDHYTVSLAHHVIAGWFLKCRLSQRRDLVNYIIASLESNIKMQFQEQRKVDFAPVNEDSSNRKRSSSLTEQGSRRRERPNITNPKQKSEMYGFHIELVETCIDFMARHTYSPCSALPKRLPTADYLLKGGQSMTWLVGHQLVTITTSGCSAAPTKNGFCDHCTSICRGKINQNGIKSDTNTSVTPLSPESSISSKVTSDTDSTTFNKRYTKASLQHSSANESESSDLTSSTNSSTAALAPKFGRQSSLNDGRFSGSSGSLEALSRRGSNPDTHETDNKENAMKNLSSILGNTLLLPQMAPTQTNTDRHREMCSCLCTGWAEICIRRATGVMSWVMRIQNQISYDSFTNEFPLHDLTSIFSPSLSVGGVGPSLLEQFQMRVDKPEKTVSISDKLSEIKYAHYENECTEEKEEEEVTSKPTLKPSLKRIVKQNEVELPSSVTQTSVGATGPIDIPGQNTKSTTEKPNPFDEFEDFEERSTENSGTEDENVEYDDSDASKSRNPVRRVNSSPEMSSSWRSPYVNTKDLNASLVIAQPKNHTHNSGVDGSGEPSSKRDAMGKTVEHKDQHSQMEIQQKPKKSIYSKDTRVSCEAIPEEIAGSTPPSLTNSLTKESSADAANTAVIGNSTSVLISSTSLPEATSAEESSQSSSTLVPKKQLSADDALLQQQQKPDLSTNQSHAHSMNLKIPIDMPKVMSKPPQSPAPLSPRLIARNAAIKIATNSGQPHFPPMNEDSSDVPRGRSKTISVVREHYGPDNLKWTLKGSANNSRFREQQQPTVTRSGISPSFVFLQLYHTGQLNVTERPLLVEAPNAKAITLFDYIPPFETHSIGVLYVGPGQSNNETEILKNRFGSMRYAEFLRNLGTLVAIKDAIEHNLFINMESGADGNFTYIWEDDIVQVTFHVATLMPNKKQDPNCNEKKKHIGNNFVTIVYNESGEEYNLNTIKGQFNYACVIVQPLELNTNKVFVIAREEIAPHVCQSCVKIVSDNSAPLLARQLALHANLASKVSKSLTTKNQSPYASNWLERLRKIKHLRTKLLEGQKSKHVENSSGSASNDLSSSGGASSKSFMNDFTGFTN